MHEETKSRRRRLEIEDRGDVTVVTFTDRKILDEEKTEAIGDQLSSHVDQGRKTLVLNFANVQHMSSAVLGTLITLRKKVLAAGGKLVLCAIDPQIFEVFKITGLDKQFVICAGKEEAAQMF
jgi:anti-sigma B factor antagonist